MKQVKIEKSKLLSALKNNCKKHSDDFAEIEDNYRLSLMDLYEKRLQQLSEGEIPKNEVPYRPHHHLDDYDAAILMVEMEVENTVVLEQREFEQLVMDRWSWQKEFEISKTMYGK